MVKRVTYQLIFFCLIVLFAVQSATAQQQKIGYIDTDYILSQMSEYEGIQQQLESISSEWNARLEKMKNEVEQLKEDFAAKEILYTDKLRKEKKQEIEAKMKQRQQFLDQKFGAEGEYFRKQKELLEPIQRKIFNAVNSVAQRKNFDFIFDKAQKSDMIYSAQEWNLNKEVLEELGVTLNESSN